MKDIKNIIKRIQGKDSKKEIKKALKELNENLSELSSTPSSGSGEDMEVVEITFSQSLPKTGTLTQEEVTKLSSDNCILKVNGTYYHKSYESGSGIDYLPISIRTYMNGLDRPYFTVNKSSRQYTIAYSNFVEANQTLQPGHTPSRMTNLKVGNTVYSVPSTMIVDGSIGTDGYFTASENNTELYASAVALFKSGGAVVLHFTDDGSGAEYESWCPLVKYEEEKTDTNPWCGFTTLGSDYYWVDPNYDPN